MPNTHAYVHRLPIVGLTNLVRISKENCDAVMAVAGRTELFHNKELDRPAIGAWAATHEAEHVLRDPMANGLPDEAATDCYAFQEMYDVVIAFGASEDVAHQVTVRAIDIRGDRAPEAYEVSPDTCREGGALDLDQTGYFPHAAFIGPQSS